MKHEMKLSNDAFRKIASGKKTIEIRLNDEKRKLVHQGDTIVFTNTLNKNKIETLVKNVFVFNDFKELYASFSKDKLGYEENENADYNDMFKIYSKEQVADFKVMAIELELTRDFAKEELDKRIKNTADLLKQFAKDNGLEDVLKDLDF